jgi:RHS repeat-associated protein
MPETNFFWDPLSDNILEERDETGDVTTEYTTEPGLYGNLISQNRDGVESQYHFDALGSTLALTDDDQQVTDTYAYTAFGEVTAHTGSTLSPFHYVGQRGYYQDESMSDCAVRRRPLSTRVTRWLTLDQRSYADSVNLYLYTHNRPTSLIDPSGDITLGYDSVRLPNDYCGAFRWDVAWKLTDCKESGFIVQFITINIVAYDCIYPGRTCPTCDLAKPLVREAQTYTESWYVKYDPKDGTCRIYDNFCPGAFKPVPKGSAHDTWCYGGSRPPSNNPSCGSLLYFGEAFFVPLRALAKSQYRFAGAKWAGCLYSMGGHDGALLKSAMGNRVERALSHDWNCCIKGGVAEHRCCNTRLVAVDYGVRATDPCSWLDVKAIQSKRCRSAVGAAYKCPQNFDPRQCPCINKSPSE